MRRSLLRRGEALYATVDVVNDHFGSILDLAAARSKAVSTRSSAKTRPRSARTHALEFARSIDGRKLVPRGLSDQKGNGIVLRFSASRIKSARILKISQLVRLVFLTVSFLSAAKTAWSYVPEETAWPKSSTVVIQLGLGSTARSLQDGSGSWNASAADAAAIWNGYCDFISFSTVSSPTVPEQAGDGVNSAFFSNTVFGDSFGSDTLAATVIQIGVGQITLETTETDVVVNTAYAYDSYRGPQQPGLYDLHRIMLHEFGHVLGLDHVVFNPPGQAIMEPEISDFDHLGADDVAGIRSLYGATFSFLPSSISLRVGDSYSSDPYNTNNDATSYSASGLPPGLTINSSSGQITGTTTVEGDYGPVITAHGPIADAYGTYPIKVLGLDLIRGLLSIIHTRSASIVPDPIRPRTYLNGNDQIEMVDTATYATTQLAPSVHGYRLYGFRLSRWVDPVIHRHQRAITRTSN